MATKEETAATVGMIGSSPSFLRVLGLLGRMASCDAPVLIEGETGTGKELAARAVHYQGARRSRPFVPVNCGAIPDGLLESELFGYRRGAFTDAKESSPGILVLADTGTLFLDEVDALSAKGQVALLRFLQERKVRALGAAQEVLVDVRVIAASNRALPDLVEKGLFRRDLFYRLNVLVARLPPLRSRGEDVLFIAESFLRALAARHGRPTPAISPCLRQFLLSYQWPGNIRELENLIEREFLLSDCTDTLRMPTGEPPQLDDEGFEEEVRAAEPPVRLTETASADARSSLNYRVAKAEVIEAFDRSFLQSLMQQFRGNVSEAARAACKERRDLGRLLGKYSIRPASFRG
jgi:DNA-binding NtrC family response regulator